MTKDDVRAYYATFAEREWQRLEKADDGAIEYTVTCAMLERYLPAPGGRVLDIGGGPGRYAIWLAERGYRVVLADISPRLLADAQNRLTEEGVAEQIEAVVEADACDLRLWSNASFDAILNLGPFYHLPKAEDRERAAQEMARVLRPGGVAFVALMPRYALLKRTLAKPDERKHLADPSWLARLMNDGIFENSAAGHFTHAYGAQPAEIEPFFRRHGLEQIALLAAESIAGGVQATVVETLKSEPNIQRTVLNLLIESASDPSILGAANHLLYIGRRSSF